MIDVKIGGGVAKYKLLLITLLKMKAAKEPLRLTFYDMPNNCVWNGGRINRDIELTEQMLETFNKHSHGFCLGFTNSVILDVGDETGNKLLEMVSSRNPHKLHGVVLMSETLRRHIRKNFPDLKLTYSITGHPTTDQLNFEGYYKELEAKYDVIVPKYSHLQQILPLMEAGKLDGSKYEILINDNCNTTCQFYSEHFAQISHMNSTYQKPWEEVHDQSYQVEIKPKTKIIQKTGNCVQDNIKYETLKRFHNAGVTHYKISGRDLQDDSFEFFLPQHLGEVRKLLG